MNNSKLDLARLIQFRVRNEISETQLEGPGRRDFVINFDKIAVLRFFPATTLEGGVDELIRLYSWYRPYQNFRPI